ncbi:DUF5590 domain-containing protein [Leuconostoc rapi]|uniref:cell wall elongation regulator TseB-like domain-containing protein n=1 Tax=Leuconostoc rapi TaxID=1406906 RepID=UPI00195B54B7|nr:DUF5590 domain-containing protein [Leuconostoc rapi]MBM7434938.1 uncharacterized protein YpmB [Leuconostoc rapi]
MMQFKDDIRIRQRRKQNRVHWSRVWFIAAGIGIVLAALTICYFYVSLTPMRRDESRLQRFVKTKTDIATVQQISVDHRQKTTYAITGTTASGQQKVAIVRGKSDQVKTYDRRKGLSDKKLRQLILTTYKPKKIYSANISEYKHALVWEVSYKGQDNTLNYVTLDFKTGNPYRVIKGL